MRLYWSLDVVIVLAAPTGLDGDGGLVVRRRDIVRLGELLMGMFESSKLLSSVLRFATAPKSNSPARAA